jgi:hypothetical protein
MRPRTPRADLTPGTEPCRDSDSAGRIHQPDIARDRPLTFSGGSSVTIPPGALAVSDPVFLDVPAMGDLAVSIYLPGPTGPPTNHFFSMQTNYVSPPGNFVAAADMPVASTETCISAFGFTFCSSPWLFLAGVEVMASKQTSAVVTLGDSITDPGGA